ncbi:hypothetical protein FBEOM_277 [Fusarium beomiforme]|uniref:HNH nuclease domain-containing protein n=1 Tax=Fusarium beomiforme TaxID=44412 RepID=A0A9P5AVG4_9HYPO|nr:hypothetical protein FBEOM_277 [Fusarium beomiforme]
MADAYDIIDESRLLPNVQDSFGRQVRIIHPGYYYSGGDPDFDVLISFEAFDNDGSGVDYDTAHTACAIIAGNTWDGYFSKDPHGKEKIHPPNRVLSYGRYYFCLPSSNDPSTDQYPIIPRFKDWRFPHNNLPPIWKRLYSQYRSNGSPRCVMSNCGDVVEQAHLVPSQQSSWWTQNLMKKYSRTSLFSTDQIDAPANLLPLRCDIHKIFDERHFAFVPKKVISREAREKHMEEVRESNAEQLQGDAERSGPSPDSQLPIRSLEPPYNSPQTNSPIHIVGHVFNSTPSGDLPRRFHNRAIHTLPSTLSIDLLFARFAYTIFSPSVFKDFLDSDKGRYIMTWDHEKKQHDIGFASAEKCHAIWNASRSRSESPRKRSKAAGDGPEDGYAAGLGSDVDSGYGDNSWTSLAEDEPRRGRTRKRDWEEDILDVFGTKRTKLQGRTKQIKL